MRPTDQSQKSSDRQRSASYVAMQLQCSTPGPSNEIRFWLYIRSPMQKQLGAQKTNYVGRSRQARCRSLRRTCVTTPATSIHKDALQSQSWSLSPTLPAQAGTSKGSAGSNTTAILVGWLETQRRRGLQSVHCTLIVWPSEASKACIDLKSNLRNPCVAGGFTRQSCEKMG